MRVEAAAAKGSRYLLHIGARSNARENKTYRSRKRQA